MTVSNSGNTINIEGNIKSVSDFQEIKKTIDAIHDKSIKIVIKDSFSITSSVIGYLNKITHKDGVSIQMAVSDARLYELLNDLSLISLFNVHKI